MKYILFWLVKLAVERNSKFKNFHDVSVKAWVAEVERFEIGFCDYTEITGEMFDRKSELVVIVTDKGEDLPYAMTQLLFETSVLKIIVT